MLSRGRVTGRSRGPAAHVTANSTSSRGSLGVRGADSAPSAPRRGLRVPTCCIFCRRRFLIFKKLIFFVYFSYFCLLRPLLYCPYSTLCSPSYTGIYFCDGFYRFFPEEFQLMFHSPQHFGHLAISPRSPWGCVEFAL